MPSRKGSTSTAWSGKGACENLRENGGVKLDDGKAKQHTIIEDSMSENVMLQSKQKQIEQQEGRHRKRHKVNITYYLDLREEAIGAGEWEVDGRQKEHHKPVVKDGEENQTREENQERHEGLSVKL